jgi:2-dehydro-3-deoxyphosphogluconate aldolase/(4S)-4-hydroxy-2-oxoglutarate aldolase
VTIPNQLGQFPVLPILNEADQKTALRVAEALTKGGIGAFEITLRNPDALGSLQAVRKEFPSLTLGAGTILEKEQISQVRDLGIDFGVCPGWDNELWVHSQELNFPLIPGILTPTELALACQFGCRTLKVFPIEPAGGIAYLKSLIAPFHSLGVKYLPTGGIGREQVAAYLKEDSVLAVGGSWLTPRNLIEKKDFQEITELAIASLSLAN